MTMHPYINAIAGVAGVVSHDTGTTASLFNWTQAIYGLHAFSLLTGIWERRRSSARS
jgi:hypothetical protein